MNTLTLKNKNQIKLAFRQAFEENKEILENIFVDVMEDIAFGNAIQE
jgi:hypothetical protein